MSFSKDGPLPPGSSPRLTSRSGSTRRLERPPPTDRPRSPSDESENSILPRKEVIQPHLPVQLPCYDFVPVTDPTLGAYFP